MSDRKVRVRFAPSPTGALHIGGLRTALFNYLFAKKHGGDFVLRIEDTDQNRYVDGAEDYIIESLHWSQIPFDEGPGREAGFGPYRQSERQHLYKEYAEKLITSGNAYYAFDTPESLEKIRAAHEQEGKTFIYNWHNRKELNNSLSLCEKELKELLASKESYVIRFKAPEKESVYLQDEIRGEIRVETEILDDKILFKSDGMPTYHLANIVDDHLMEITHVIRGEEWLPSLALHVLLYSAFEWEAPKFAHLPLILKPQGKGKLSKRDGAKLGFPVFPLEWKDPNSNEVFSGYREEGYIPAAVINMLAFLGWNEGGGSEKEIYSLKELISAFSLEHVSKGGSKFDPEKTNWFQHHYFQEMDTLEMTKKLKVLLEKKGLDFPLPYIEKVVLLLKERNSFISDFWTSGSYFFTSPETYDQKVHKKTWKEGTPKLMSELKGILSGIEDFSEEDIQNQVKNWITETGIGFGKVMQPFRLSLVGTMQGPEVFVIAATIGKEETLSRLQNAIERL